ncbi:MAG: hypothetical protein ACQSGP_22310, partial [Frankia sp.]
PSAHRGTRPSSSAAPTSTPSPSLLGLCHAYTAGVAGNPGKALDNPAFSALTAAAGGRDRIGAYCATVLTTAPGNGPVTPAAGHPTTNHPTGKPTSRPASAPLTHPTGKPTTHPTHPTGAAA